MSTFVLVHGAWGGAWIWRRILGPLRAAGHEAHAVTLTGDGERAHLRRADISLADHIDDVIGLIDAEELQDIILVGHSYAGMVITGVADALLAPDDRDERGVLQRLVYVDAQVPWPGESWSSLHSAEMRAERQAAAHANDGALPPIDPAVFGLEGADRDWLLRRQVAHPFGPYQEPLMYDADRLARLPRHYIACTQPMLASAPAHHARVRAAPGWQFTEIATGHCPMVSAPQALLALLRTMA
jgi:pimeloyl-ACP methyl ester carboxylesterase